MPEGGSAWHRADELRAEAAAARARAEALERVLAKPMVDKGTPALWVVLVLAGAVVQARMGPPPVSALES
jgi:hypothetical protein